MDSLSGFIEAADPFMRAFIPLFVAMDAVGILPIYIGLTSGLDERERRRTLFYSIVTATLITLSFLLVGKAVFILLAITVADFQIAGGLVLLSIAIVDIVQTTRGAAAEGRPTSAVGIVPIGTPIIAGPAVLTTLIMLHDLYGFTVTASALAANLLISWVVYAFADRIIRVIGENGARGISKVVSLLLAAIAVMIIRRGLEGLAAGG
ncbi:MAG TPA: MarC family protein [Deltaproteobacteria bacterium]|nr:MarC family protein [Deltaproteobacteria bacterium]